MRQWREEGQEQRIQERKVPQWEWQRQHLLKTRLEQEPSCQSRTWVLQRSRWRLRQSHSRRK